MCQRLPFRSHPPWACKSFGRMGAQKIMSIPMAMIVYHDDSNPIKKILRFGVVERHIHAYLVDEGLFDLVILETLLHQNN